MQTMKRGAAILLAALLALSVLPFGALASEGQEEADEAITEEAATKEPLTATPAPTDADTDTEAAQAPIGELASSVQSMIDALPAVEDVCPETEDELNDINYHYWIARQSYDCLTESEKAEVDTARMDELGQALLASTPMILATTYRQKAWTEVYLDYSLTRNWTDAEGRYRTAIINRIADHWMYDTDSGHACYCIRPDMGAADYYFYNTGTFAWYDEINEAQRNMIRLLLLYGYPNCSNTAGHSKYHSSAYCQAATQLAIFEVITNCFNTSAPYSHTDNTWSDAIPYSSDRSSFYMIYWNIISRIQNDGWLPSWLYDTRGKADASPIELTYNEATGLYEVNYMNLRMKNSNADSYGHMVDDFEYSLPEGVTATRDTSVGNEYTTQYIKITATAEALEATDGTIRIKAKTPYMVKSSSQSAYPATVYIYGRQYSGNVWYQSMIQVEKVQTEPVMAYMTLHADTFGEAEIIKTSDDGNVSGITFTVVNNGTGESQTVTTGADGKILLKKLKPGTYTVTEAVPVEYVADRETKTVTVESGKTATVNFSNTLKRFRVLVTKQDASSGTHTSGTLQGAVYGLYHNGTLVKQYTTNADGQFYTDYYPCGEGWTIREITPSQGYQLDETAYTVGAAPGSFSLAQNTVPLTVLEMPVPGEIAILKTDSSGKPLAGATYLLEFSADGGQTWQPVTCRTGPDVTAGGCTSPSLVSGTLTTGADGRAVFSGLRADDYIQYRLTETAAPEGHTLLKDSAYVGTLPMKVDGDILYEISYTVRDGLVMELPMTGSASLWLMVMGAALVGGAIPMGYYFAVMKKERND